MLLAVLLPLVTIVGYAVVTAMRGSLLLILPLAIASVVTSVGSYLSYKSNRDREEGKQNAYKHHLTELRDQMLKAHEAQRDFYRHNLPDPAIALQWAKKNHARLWERRVTDADFGAMRLGMGRRPSTVQLSAPNSDSFDAPLLPAALKLVEEFVYVQDVPVDLSLLETNAVGVVSKDPALGASFTRALLVHLAALHAPSELRLHIVSAPEARNQWHWARYLPHCNVGSSVQGDQLCFDTATLTEFWDRIQTELERRESRVAAGGDGEPGFRVPLHVVVVDMSGHASAARPTENLMAETTVSLLLNRGRQLGAALIFLEREQDRLPGECQAVIEVERSGENAFFRCAHTGVNGPRRDGRADLVDAAQAERDFAVHLAPLVMRTTHGADLPITVGFLDLYLSERISEAMILERWRQSREQVDGFLSVPIGITTGGKQREIVFHSDGDGIHGMVAGTTGSGKSELLLTLIVGLALRYDPSIVNFALVDFKGGTAFEALRALPHTVDVITNLQGNLGTRAFTAIRAELNRRQVTIKEAGVTDIYEYQRRGDHLRKPLPHLFVIIDEFADMIKQRPEFRAPLESIAMLGRSLGVSLILAAQRPGGVVSDQILANVKLRICLRVEGLDESRDMIGRADAAFLQSIPGRAYLKTSKEKVELVQVAHMAGTAAALRTSGAQPAGSTHAGLTEADAGAEPREEKLSTALVGFMNRLQREHSDTIRRQPKPWPDPLPEKDLSLAELDAVYHGWLDGKRHWPGAFSSGHAMQTIVGLLDNPVAAQQSSLILDFNAGHVVLFSAPGWGKTTFLQTVIAGLIAHHSPEELHLYLLDCGGRGLEIFDGLPHLGAFITSAETERVQRLFRRLLDVLEQRKVIFSQRKVGNLEDYHEQYPEEALPAILLVIDNLAELRAALPNELDRLISLAREGRAYGIHVVMTADQMTTVPAVLYSLFTERLALRLADSSEYAGIVGRSIPDAADIPGRGYIRRQRATLEFQVATPSPTPEGLSQLVSAMREHFTGAPAPKIEILRPVISAQSLLNGTLPADSGIPVGMDDRDLKPVYIDLQRRGPHLIVVGPPLSGATTTLHTMVSVLARCYAPQDASIILIDFQRRLFDYGGSRRLNDLPHVLETVADWIAIDELLERLKAELEYRSANGKTESKLYIVIDNYDDLAQEAASHRATLSRFGALVRQYGSQGLHCIVSASLNVVRGNDEFMRHVTASRYSLALDAGETAVGLGARLRPGVGEFPPGRGYLIKSGHAILIQMATPQQEQTTMEEALDLWVDEVCRNADTRATWSYPSE